MARKQRGAENAATQPTTASAMAGKSRGESGFAGGASSNVNTASTRAKTEIPATIQNNGRQPPACA